MPCSAPRGYRDGPFELDDEAETAWKLSGFRQVFSGTIEAPRDQAAKAAAENLEELAQKLTEDQDQSESDEDRYTFDVDEKEDSLTFQADFSTAQAGGSYEKPVTRGNVTLCVVHQRMRVMRFHITVSHLLASVADYPQVRFYIAGLGVPDEELPLVFLYYRPPASFCQKILNRLLESAVWCCPCFGFFKLGIPPPVISRP